MNGTRDKVMQVLGAKHARGTTEYKLNCEFEGGRTEWIMESKVNKATKMMARDSGLMSFQ